MRTPSAVVAYPGLGRHANVTGQNPRQYRVRLAAELYVPFYRANSNGIGFTAFPYNETNPPAVIVGMATDTLLLPAPDYPFVTHIPVLRGLVVDPARKPVPDVYVTQRNSERALTDRLPRHVRAAAALGPAQYPNFHRCNGSANRPPRVDSNSAP